MSLRREYFDALYATERDPWSFATRWYEERKYALTLAALPHARYRRGFEPGCSIGVFTAQLAARCDRLVASDLSPRALSTAAGSVPGNVELVRGAVPHDWPQGTFDLIVCSEIGYYLSSDDLDRLRERIATTLEPAGHLLAVHWRPEVVGYPGDGAIVHGHFAELFRRLAHYEDEFILLDVFAGTAGSLVPPQ